jgi:hypothetical protein
LQGNVGIDAQNQPGHFIAFQESEQAIRVDRASVGHIE